MVTAENAHEHFANLPEQHLYHMATNDSTRPEFKKVAVKLMLEKGYKSAQKPEFADIVKSLESASVEFHTSEVPATLPAHSGSVLIVKGDVESPAPNPALTASFTTASINPPAIESVQKTDKPAIPEPANEAAKSVANPSI